MNDQTVDQLRETIKAANRKYVQLVANIIRFAGELEAWGLEASASNLLTEVLGNEVNAPTYDRLKREVETLKGRRRWRQLNEFPYTGQEIYGLTRDGSICKWIYAPEMVQIFVRDFIAWLPREELLPEGL